MSTTQPVFQLSAKSGLIAAATVADSVLFAWRNPSATVVQFLHRLEVRARTVTGYSAAFENGLSCRQVSSFAGANYSGGTDLSHPTTAANKAYSRMSIDALVKPKAESVLDTGNVRIATTTGLTHGGAPVIASHSFLHDGCAELVAAATVNPGAFDLVWDAPYAAGAFVPMPFVADAGFIIRNPIALGAGGTLRVFVTVIWSEKG